MCPPAPATPRAGSGAVSSAPAPRRYCPARARPSSRAPSSAASSPSPWVRARGLPLAPRPRGPVSANGIWRPAVRRGSTVRGSMPPRGPARKQGVRQQVYRRGSILPAGHSPCTARLTRTAPRKSSGASRKRAPPRTSPRSALLTGGAGATACGGSPRRPAARGRPAGRVRRRVTRPRVWT